MSHSKDARWEARDQEHEQHGGRALGGEEWGGRLGEKIVMIDGVHIYE